MWLMLCVKCLGFICCSWDDFWLMGSGFLWVWLGWEGDFYVCWICVSSSWCWIVLFDFFCLMVLSLIVMEIWCDGFLYWMSGWLCLIWCGVLGSWFWCELMCIWICCCCFIVWRRVIWILCCVFGVLCWRKWWLLLCLRRCWWYEVYFW